MRWRRSSCLPALTKNECLLELSFCSSDRTDAACTATVCARAGDWLNGPNFVLSWLHSARSLKESIPPASLMCLGFIQGQFAICSGHWPYEIIVVLARVWIRYERWYEDANWRLHGIGNSNFQSAFIADNQMAGRRDMNTLVRIHLFTRALSSMIEPA